jgi:hypothetical protein
MKMKQMKMLVLALVLAAVLMAIIGAGTSSATMLCNSNTTPCSNLVTINTVVDLESTSSHVFKPGFATVKCEKSEIAWKLESQSETGGAAKGAATGLTFAECDATVVVLQKGSLQIAHTAGTMNGTVSSEGLLIELATGGIKCKYGTPTLRAIGSITGGSPATVKVEAQLVKVEGGALCVNPATWTGNYSVGFPNPLYISDK